MAEVKFLDLLYKSNIAVSQNLEVVPWRQLHNQKVKLSRYFVAIVVVSCGTTEGWHWWIDGSDGDTYLCVYGHAECHHWYNDLRHSAWRLMPTTGGDDIQHNSTTSSVIWLQQFLSFSQSHSHTHTGMSPHLILLSDTDYSDPWEKPVSSGLSLYSP